MKFQENKKLKKLPPYLFVDLDKRKKEAVQRGVDIISFGVGDPDLETPKHIVVSGQRALAKAANHHYPFGSGLKEFREAVSKWYEVRFGVSLNPQSEVHAIIGSKEGIGHLPLGFIDPGDVVLVPEPGYPVYHTGTIMAGGEPYFMPLKEYNRFLPDLDAIPPDIARKAKIMFLNYPNNPTSAVADAEFFVKVIAFADKYNILVAHDAAYSELYYENPPISFLSVPGAKDAGVEFHSLSKTFSMTGWRIGWVCGNAKVIKTLSAVKDNYDSGVFNAVQEAGVTALSASHACVEDMRAIYKKRRDLLCDGLRKYGWDVQTPEATFYVWAKTPHHISSQKCVEVLLEEAGIVSTPGSGLGASGEGYVRFSLTVNEYRIIEAVERISKIKW
ncbi:MAG: LL-diaminopimelate aminotransferase [bacterium]